MPLLVGEPLLLQGLWRGAPVGGPPRDWEVRRTLEAEALERGREALHRELAAQDPESAARIHPRDLQRLVRALEILRCSGKTPSWWYAQGKTLGGEFSLTYVGLLRPYIKVRIYFLHYFQYLIGH